MWRVTYGRKLKSYGDFECSVELWNEHVLKMVDQFRFLRSIGYIDFLLIPAFFGLSGQYTILYYVYFVFPFYWGCGEWMDVASSRSLHSRFLNCLSILFFFFSFLFVFTCIQHRYISACGDLFPSRGRGFHMRNMNPAWLYTTQL